nr:hypothetical protein Ade03nite_52660 [Actinoplanes derwentensis]
MPVAAPEAAGSADPPLPQAARKAVDRTARPEPASSERRDNTPLTGVFERSITVTLPRRLIKQLYKLFDVPYE